MIQRLQYLRMSYLNILNSNINDPISFKRSCEQGIQQMDEIGIKTIKDYQTIMKWNRVFCTNYIFPHPNYYVEMGKSDQPVFLETFPEVKLELTTWAKLNLSNLCCESIGVQLK